MASATFRNLKGNVFEIPATGYYNLETNRIIKHPKEDQLVNETYGIVGNRETFQQFSQLNNLDLKKVLPKEFWPQEPTLLERTFQALHITKESETCQLGKNACSKDIEKIPKEDLESLCEFSLFGLFGKALVTDIIDGDTITIAMYVPVEFLQQLQPRKIGKDIVPRCSILPYKQSHGFVAKFRCRLFGLDAIESHQVGGPEATALLTSILNRTNDYVWVEMGDLDKYRRFLVTLYADEARKHSINNELLESPLFSKYFGGTKSQAFKNLPKISNYHH